MTISDSGADTPVEMTGPEALAVPWTNAKLGSIEIPPAAVPLDLDAIEARHAAAVRPDPLYGGAEFSVIPYRPEMPASLADVPALVTEARRLRERLAQSCADHRAAESGWSTAAGDRDRAREEARLWRARADALNGDCSCGGLTRGLICGRCERADAALAAMRAAGIDPDAPEAR